MPGSNLYTNTVSLPVLIVTEQGNGNAGTSNVPGTMEQLEQALRDATATNKRNSEALTSKDSGLMHSWLRLTTPLRAESRPVRQRCHSPAVPPGFELQAAHTAVAQATTGLRRSSRSSRPPAAYWMAQPSGRMESSQRPGSP